MIDQTISHYHITAKLGEGGMGEVYLAHDSKLNRKVALKFLPASMMRDPEVTARFVQEARAAAAIRHPNIVTIFDIGEHESRPFIAMEHIEGETLREWSLSKPRALADSLRIIRGIGEGLQRAHELGIIHRDLKPENILVESDGRPRVVDFGLARVYGAARITRDGSTLGTAAYMSPEQVAGLETDARSDIWSLGVILYELLTGRSPFRRDFEQATLYAILNETPENPAELSHLVPQEAADVVLKMLARRPEDRYSSVADCLTDLDPPAKFQGSRSGAELGIVVLPFDDISPGKDNEYFSDGLTEEIIADLSKIAALRVISRTSAMRYKGTKKSIREIGRELSISHVLEGSVRKAGDKLRITAQLIEAESDHHLWAEKYSGSLNDIFEIQEKVSQEIARAMAVTLTPREQEDLVARPIGDPRAYDCYLQARHDIKWSDEELSRAHKKLQMGLDIVGDNAVLFAGMGYLHYQYVNAGLRQEDCIQKAREYVDRALALDPNLGHAHLVAGMLLQAFEGDQKQAVYHLKRALEATPNDTDTLFWLNVGYGIYGLNDEAGPLVERMEHVDPFNQWTHMARGWFHFTNGEYRAALEPYNRAHSLYPTGMTGFLIALGLLYDGEMEEALRRQIQFEEMSFFLDRVILMFLYGHQERFDEAGALVTDDLRASARRDPQWSWHLAAGYAAIGENDLALDWLGNAVSKGFTNYRMIGDHDPFLARLRGDARFEEMVDRARRRQEELRTGSSLQSAKR